MLVCISLRKVVISRNDVRTTLYGTMYYGIVKIKDLKISPILDERVYLQMELKYR
jgi:hypothetical protein